MLADWKDEDFNTGMLCLFNRDVSSSSGSMQLVASAEVS